MWGKSSVFVALIGTYPAVIQHAKNRNVGLRRLLFFLFWNTAGHVDVDVVCQTIKRPKFDFIFDPWWAISRNRLFMGG